MRLWSFFSSPSGMGFHPDKEAMHTFYGADADEAKVLSGEILPPKGTEGIYNALDQVRLVG